MTSCYSLLDLSSFEDVQPSFHIDELNWTIPLNFNFTFPFPKENSSTIVTSTTADECFIAAPFDFDVESYQGPMEGSSCSIRVCPEPHSILEEAPKKITTSQGYPLSHICDTLPSKPTISSSTSFEGNVVTAQSLHTHKKWEELKDYISESCFPTSNHSTLQSLFYQSVYEIYRMEHSLKRLTPTQRYRLRKANPVPLTIAGVKFLAFNRFNDATKSLLEAVFRENRKPAPEIIEDLAEKTELTVKQVKNFFKNKRNRK